MVLNFEENIVPFKNQLRKNVGVRFRENYNAMHLRTVLSRPLFITNYHYTAVNIQTASC